MSPPPPLPPPPTTTTTKINCPNVLSHGSCNANDCSYNHNIPICFACALSFYTNEDYQSHLSSKDHIIRTTKIFPKISFCHICLENVGGEEPGWLKHRKSHSHLNRANEMGVSPIVQPQMAASNDDTSFCGLCETQVKIKSWKAHLDSEKHRTRQTLYKCKAAEEEAEADKRVGFEGAFDWNCISRQAAIRGVENPIVIRATQPSAEYRLQGIRLYPSHGMTFTDNGFQFFVTSLPVLFSASKPFTLITKFNQSDPGRYETRIEFTFQNVQHDNDNQKFIITRTLKAVVGDKRLFHDLAPKEPYIPQTNKTQRFVKQEIGEIVRSSVVGVAAIPYKVKLPPAAVPKYLREMMELGGGGGGGGVGGGNNKSKGPETISQVMKKIKELYLPPNLNYQTYAQFFKLLLWIEEIKMEQDLVKFDMADVVLTRTNRTYSLTVPGLSENRPSIIVGSSVLVQAQADSNTDKWFEGHVHFIRKNQVGLLFHRSFHEIESNNNYDSSSSSSNGLPRNKRFHVRFKVYRLPIQRQHLSLDTAFPQDRILFPVQAHLPDGRMQTPTQVSLSFFNPLIGNNERQMQAVISIMSLPVGSPPFVVFGPPGTGKTITIVEAILQILDFMGSAKILACAPSNSAADLIAIRLSAHLDRTKLFRLYAASRSKDSIPDELQEYVYTNLNGDFSIPPPPGSKNKYKDDSEQNEKEAKAHENKLAQEGLRSFRVIVTTCQTGSIPYSIGLERGVFSHIFIDEAGQATEPEAICAIRTLASERTNVVVSGDPRQLGPIVRSGMACELGLGKSFLERLVDREVYKRYEKASSSSLGDPDANKVMVKLTKNFRSHAAILDFPNRKFYQGELEACGDPETIGRYLDTPFCVESSADFPIVFHAVLGKNDREARSPSFFNIDEIAVVRWYVEKLRSFKKVVTRDEDIGIISPYHAQCLRLRTSLNDSGGLKIGSVEEFQGQERKVIIISTVRSSKNFVDCDVRHSLGFVADPRRFNVAITRAQGLLIIVGDPNVLSLDPLWRSFLNYVFIKGGWKGPEPSWDPDEVVNEAGGYDKKVREAASMDMEEFVKRVEGLKD